MKKLFSLILIIGFSIMSYAQCNTGCITGNLTITLGQTSTFTSPIAQCTSCYDWDINNNVTSSDNQTVGTVKIVGTDMGQTVQIQGIAVGTFSLQLTYFDETGCHTCCFNGNVVQGPSCDIYFNNIGEYSQDGPLYEVAFKTLPINTSTAFTYLWTFYYANGTTSTSTDAVPVLQLPPTNKVLKTKVVVTSSICTKTIIVDWTKVYDISGLWGFCSTCRVSNLSLKKEIIVSPNPTNSLIKFDGENLNNYKVSIFNSNGDEIIKNSKIDQNISLEKQKKGIYIYIITDENGFKQEGKIIKE